MRVDGRRADFRLTNGKLRITPHAPVETGAEVLVVVEYGGAPKPRRTRWWGTIGWEELDDGVLVASQPSGAPTWFPCNDHPFDKASYRIRFETDAAYTVVANGVLEDHRVISGQGVWVYDQREPTSSYLVMVQVGPLREAVARVRRRGVRRVLPACARARGARRLRSAAEDARGVRGALRALPVRSGTRSS